MKCRLITMVLFLLTFSGLKSQITQNVWVNCNAQNCKVFKMYAFKSDSLVWDGNCVDGKAQGFGKMSTYSDGKFESLFEGSFSEGIEQGSGKIIFSDSEVISGNFINGQLSGFGSSINGSGDKYEGDFINGWIHGLGEMNYLNGTKFKGFFVKGIPYTGDFTGTDGKLLKVHKGFYVDDYIEDSSNYHPKLGVKLTEYFDQDFKRCEMANASYFRIITYSAENVPIGTIKDYYIDGTLQNEYKAVYVDYSDEDKNFYEGDMVFYYNTGIVEKKLSYYHNLVHGKVLHYYDNGRISSEEDYEFDELHGEYVFWYKSGKVKLFAEYYDGGLVDNKYIEYDEMGSGVIVYEEDFSKAEWSVTDGNTESYINDSNELVWKFSEDGLQARYSYIDLNQKGDFSIETTINKYDSKKKYSYGLLFGFKDWNNYYKFTITENGKFAIYGVSDGVSQFIADPTKSFAINKGLIGNTLKVFSIGDKFNFSINGIVVFETDGWWLQGNNIGYIASGKGIYLVENLIVREVLSEEQLESVGPNAIKDDWISSGSGFFIHPNGYIATNYHVIENTDTIEVVYFQKGEKFIFRANVVSTDSLNDLAIIQIRDPKFAPLSVIPYVLSDNTCDVGLDVFALGYPEPKYMGYEIKFTDGKISSKTGFKGERNKYQTTVPIYGGNSGGPLFDLKGNLVGVNCATFMDLENVTYAVKSNYLKILIESLPGSITCPNYNVIYELPLTEKIKLLSDCVPFIRVK